MRTIGCEPGALTFLNTVIEFDYEGDPEHLLEELFRIEESLGRKRDHQKNVSRTIDIDLLYSGDHQINNQRLQLPHPRMHQRKFVLQPLADIEAGLVLPGQTGTVREVLAQLKGPTDVVCWRKSW